MPDGRSWRRLKRNQEVNEVMKSVIFYIVSIGLVLLIGCSIWPYWNKYLITSDLKSAAIYGTKHNLEDTQNLVTEKIKESGYVFDSDNLNIEKDENNNVSISLTYKDKINFFGIDLKDLQFTVDVNEKYVREAF
jgi:hypothetical protein